MIAEGSIAGEIDGAVRGIYDVAAPERFVAIEETAAGEVHGRHAVNGGLIKGLGIAPIEFVRRLNVFGAKQTSYALGGDEDGVPTAREAAERRKVQVIIVIVADENDGDGRKVVDSNAGISVAARADPREWTGARGPDRVGQDVAGALLQEHR